MKAAAKHSHAIDHLVLPTVGLAVARGRLCDLGFSVAPDGIHPFGTANCCVFLADGTYLEPLAVADPKAAADAIGAGNVFVERDRLYRAALGDEGFSAIVLATSDATADHRRFIEAGSSAGGMLAFSRPFVDPSGHAEIAAFRLAFAAEAAATESFVFACERVNAPEIDRSALQRHGNGAFRLNGVAAVSADPARSAGFIAAVAGAAGCEETEDGIRVDLANGVVDCLDGAGFQRRFGVAVTGVQGTRLAAIRFGVADTAAAETLLRAAGVACDGRPGRLVVPPAPGQGAIFIFEEDP